MLAKNEELIDHISKLIMYIEDNKAATQNNSQIMSNFEKLSVKIKTNNRECLNKKNQKKFVPPKNPIPEPKHVHSNGIQHLVDDNDTILNQVGLGLSYQESLFINDAINVYREAEGVDFEFFGKLFSLKEDYYIIWAYKEVTEEKNDDLPQCVERECEGVNAFIIYVATANNKVNWRKLPIVTPKQMREAKKTKLMFKGDLESKLRSEKFEGTEAHYLKCQIVRILSATRLVPKGIYTINEDTGKVEVDTEVVKDLNLTKEDALSLENWVYQYPYILKCGRISNYIPSHRNEEEADELKEKLEEGDKGIERFSGAYVEDQNIWKVYAYGNEEETVNRIKDGEQFQTSYNYVIVKHLDWTGAYTIYSIEKQRSVFFYKGFGIKRSQKVLPSEVLEIATEPKQKTEIEEPNHYEEPKEEQSNQEEDADLDNAENENEELDQDN